MSDRLRRFSRYLGIRGWVLLLCSYTWGLIGVAVVLGAASDRDSVWHTEIPDPVRFAGWVGAARVEALEAGLADVLQKVTAPVTPTTATATATGTGRGN